LALTDNADGTGFVATRSNFDADATHTVYVGQAGGVWVSYGDGWIANQIEVLVANGKWFAYINSTNSDGNAYSDMQQVTVTGGGSAASDNIRTAVKTMKGTAVYWAPLAPDGFGKPTYASPVEISCRWDDVQEEFIAPSGDREMSRAKVIVDRDLKLKGMLFEGELADLSDSDTPRNNEGAWEIRLTKKNPNFRGNKFIRQAVL